ncbi:MAG: hypothetical protein AAF802_32690, partial [Planctomycetota bacterium]
VACGEHASWLRQHLAMLPGEATRVWLIARGSPQQSRSFIARLKRLRPLNATRIVMTGSLSLTRIDFRAR